MRIVQCWIGLKLDPAHPLAVFTDTGFADGKVQFIRPTHINATLRAAAKAVYNVTHEKSLALFTSHSIWVGACVALHAGGVSQQDIKFALRWRSDSFYTYLRNLPRATNTLNFWRFIFSPLFLLCYRAGYPQSHID